MGEQGSRVWENCSGSLVSQGIRKGEILAIDTRRPLGEVATPPVWSPRRCSLCSDLWVVRDSLQPGTAEREQTLRRVHTGNRDEREEGGHTM